MDVRLSLKLIVKFALDTEDPAVLKKIVNSNHINAAEKMGLDKGKVEEAKAQVRRGEERDGEGRGEWRG